MKTVLPLFLLLPAMAIAGGSNYTVSPGVSKPAGKIAEWAVPTPKFARDPAAAPVGKIYIAVMHGNKLARFDPATEKFRVFPLPTKNEGIRKMIVDAKGRLWYMGSHSGKLGVVE